MIRQRRILAEAGLATSLLLVAGCATTMGDTLAARGGECIPMKGDLTLQPQQEIYAGGDVSYKSDEVNDFFRIKSLGNYTLELTRSSDDDGTLSFGESAAEVAPNSKSDTNVRLKVSSVADATSNQFVYTEGITSVAFQASQANHQTIELAFETTCQAKN